MKTEYISFTQEEIIHLVDFMSNHLTKEITDRLARRSSIRPDGTFAGIRCLLQVMDKLENTYETMVKEDKKDE